MRMKLWSLLSVAVLLGLLASPAAAKQPTFKALEPGKFVTLRQTVPVNIVLIGYQGIDKRALLSELPKGYDPLVRQPQFYGLNGRDLGLHFDFRYRTIDAGRKFEDRFFGYLKSIGKAGPLTAFQQQYNDQASNALDVTGPVQYIDAPSVERWLNSNSSDLRIERDKGYTIYFVNWYSRNDFKFHVYTKTDDPDPDTGYNFGLLRGSRKMIAWGGSSSRSWFYDLSAGPEAWTNNWNVDTPDLDQNGVDDYHMPPIWEYRKQGYREPAQLSSDLGKVARFVGIDLLFTTSPLYDPLVTAPGLGGAKVVHIEMFEDDPGSNGLDYIDTGLVRSRLRSFEPYYTWKIALEDNQPIDQGAKRALGIFAGTLMEDDCWNAYGAPFAQLFCYFNGNLSTYVPAYGPRDYVGEIFAFNTSAANLGNQFGLLGFADDNWIDGTQTHVFMFDTPEYRDGGYGFSTTAIHEFGHHIGMSHPHDGYDSELGLDFNAADQYEFAQSGDESATIMSYIDLSSRFSVFDRDNMHRYETAGYLNWSNALLADILASPKAGQVSNQLAAADDLAGLAQREFAGWNYDGAARHARRAYERLLEAAARIGVDSPRIEAALRAIPGRGPLKVGDPIRFPDN